MGFKICQQTKTSLAASKKERKKEKIKRIDVNIKL